MENEDRKQSSKRVAFTQLYQVGSDFAMAMALQEQERAFSMLETIESDEESESSYESNDNNEYEYFEGLEAGGELGFLEEQVISDDDEDEDEDEDEDMEEEEEEEEDEIDPDDLSYEELIALGDIVGVEKRGLSQSEISSSLVPTKFQSVECKSGIDRCVICQVEYEEDESLVALPSCEHPYHSECISKWLQMKKICPICCTEISPSNNIARNV